MTAEIAILNKTAVALAADSAVTISAGHKEEKIFDSADKLFELSNNNPIGIMIYNETSFMQVPLQSIIRQFRHQLGSVKKIELAARSFLEFLDQSGRSAPQEVHNANMISILLPIGRGIRNRVSEKVQERFLKAQTSATDPRSIVSEILDTEIALKERIYQNSGDANFIGDGDLVCSEETDSLISEVMAKCLPNTSEEQKSGLLNIGRLALKKGRLSDGRTGLVIAGFGSGELFPTLISFEIDGMVCGRLKFVETNSVDIDRLGPKARVIPFAQKEMVERFLYGLDERIQNKITVFCKNSVPEIQAELKKYLRFDTDEDSSAWDKKAQEAEEVFYSSLNKEAFDDLRQESRSEIEDMVEFMPKPELAKMAEALVNLTSIKRRVSRGMETVGGPIDVAVISQSEGFVWVKRKHYFPAELNSRYFERVKHTILHCPEAQNAAKIQPGSPSRRGRSAKKSRKIKDVEEHGEGGGDH